MISPISVSFKKGLLYPTFKFGTNTVSEGYLDQVGYLDQNFDLDSKLTEALKLSFFMWYI